MKAPAAAFYRAPSNKKSLPQRPLRRFLFALTNHSASVRNPSELQEILPQLSETVPQVLEMVPPLQEMIPQLLEIIPQVLEMVPQVKEMIKQHCGMISVIDNLFILVFICYIYN